MSFSPRTLSIMSMSVCTEVPSQPFEEDTATSIIRKYGWLKHGYPTQPEEQSCACCSGAHQGGDRRGQMGSGSFNNYNISDICVERAKGKSFLAGNPTTDAASARAASASRARSSRNLNRPADNLSFARGASNTRDAVNPPPPKDLASLRAHCSRSARQQRGGPAFLTVIVHKGGMLSVDVGEVGSVLVRCGKYEGQTSFEVRRQNKMLKWEERFTLPIDPHSADILEVYVLKGKVKTEKGGHAVGATHISNDALHSELRGYREQVPIRSVREMFVEDGPAKGFVEMTWQISDEPNLGGGGDVTTESGSAFGGDTYTALRSGRRRSGTSSCVGSDAEDDDGGGAYAADGTRVLDKASRAIKQSQLQADDDEDENPILPLPVALKLTVKKVKLLGQTALGMQRHKGELYCTLHAADGMCSEAATLFRSSEGTHTSLATRISSTSYVATNAPDGESTGTISFDAANRFVSLLCCFDTAGDVAPPDNNNMTMNNNSLRGGGGGGSQRYAQSASGASSASSSVVGNVGSPSSAGYGGGGASGFAPSRSQANAAGVGNSATSSSLSQQLLNALPSATPDAPLSLSVVGSVVLNAEEFLSQRKGSVSFSLGDAEGFVGEAEVEWAAVAIDAAFDEMRSTAEERAARRQEERERRRMKRRAAEAGEEVSDGELDSMSSASSAVDEGEGEDEEDAEQADVVHAPIGLSLTVIRGVDLIRPNGVPLLDPVVSIAVGPMEAQTNAMTEARYEENDFTSSDDEAEGVELSVGGGASSRHAALPMQVSMADVAKIYGCSLTDLMRLNSQGFSGGSSNGAAPNNGANAMVSSSQLVTLPTRGKAETVDAFCRRTGITVHELSRLNPSLVNSTDIIRPLLKLVVPAAPNAAVANARNNASLKVGGEGASLKGQASSAARLPKAERRRLRRRLIPSDILWNQEMKFLEIFNEDGSLPEMIEVFVHDTDESNPNGPKRCVGYGEAALSTSITGAAVITIYPTDEAIEAYGTRRKKYRKSDQTPEGIVEDDGDEEDNGRDANGNIRPVGQIIVKFAWETEKIPQVARIAAGENDGLNEDVEEKRQGVAEDENLPSAFDEEQAEDQRRLGPEDESLCVQGSGFGLDDTHPDEGTAIVLRPRRTFSSREEENAYFDAVAKGIIVEDENADEQVSNSYVYAGDGKWKSTLKIASRDDDICETPLPFNLRQPTPRSLQQISNTTTVTEKKDGAEISPSSSVTSPTSPSAKKTLDPARRAKLQQLLLSKVKSGDNNAATDADVSSGKTIRFGLRDGNGSLAAEDGPAKDGQCDADVDGNILTAANASNPPIGDAAGRRTRQGDDSDARADGGRLSRAGSTASSAGGRGGGDSYATYQRKGSSRGGVGVAVAAGSSRSTSPTASRRSTSPTPRTGGGSATQPNYYNDRIPIVISSTNNSDALAAGSKNNSRVASGRNSPFSANVGAGRSAAEAFGRYASTADSRGNTPRSGMGASTSASLSNTARSGNGATAPPLLTPRGGRTRVTPLTGSGVSAGVMGASSRNGGGGGGGNNGFGAADYGNAEQRQNDDGTAADGYKPLHHNAYSQRRGLGSLNNADTTNSYGDDYSYAGYKAGPASPVRGSSQTAFNNGNTNNASNAQNNNGSGNASLSLVNPKNITLRFGSGGISSAHNPSSPSRSDHQHHHREEENDGEESNGVDSNNHSTSRVRFGSGQTYHYDPHGDENMGGRNSRSKYGERNHVNPVLPRSRSRSASSPRLKSTLGERPWYPPGKPTDDSKYPLHLQRKTIVEQGRIEELEALLRAEEEEERRLLLQQQQMYMNAGGFTRTNSAKRSSSARSQRNVGGN